MDFQDTNTKVLLLVIVVLTVILIGGAVFIGGQPPAATPTTTVNVSGVKIEGNPFVGLTNAPVTVMEFADYQCPACKQFESNALPQIIKDYVATGKVKIVFKDFAFIGPDSQMASLVARAVWEVAPEKFYEWHAAAFKAQAAENSGWAKKETLVALAKTLGIDADKVNKLMVDNAVSYQTSIDADKTEGVSFGIQGTPSVIIGNRLIYGVTSYDAVKSMIEAQLNKNP